MHLVSVPLFALLWSEFITFPAKGQFLARHFIVFIGKIVAVNIFLPAIGAGIGIAGRSDCFPVDGQKGRVLIGTGVAGQGGTISGVIAGLSLHVQTAFQSFPVHFGGMHKHATFRSGIGLIPYRSGRGRELNIATFPEPHKVAETVFFTAASHTVYKDVAAAFMLFRTTHHFNAVIEYRVRHLVEPGIDQRIRKFQHTSCMDASKRIDPYVKIHGIRGSRGAHFHSRQKQTRQAHTAELYASD